MLKYDEILSNYKRLYGEKKFNKIDNHISNSKHTRNFINESLHKGILPTGTSFVSCVLSNLRYSVASADTVLFASLSLFELWLDSFGLTNGYLDKNSLKEVEDEIIKKTSSMSFNSDPSILAEINDNETNQEEIINSEASHSEVNQNQVESLNFDDKPFPYYGKEFITDVMREIDMVTGEEYTGQLTIGLFEFSERFIKNNYDDNKGDIAYDRDDLPGFKKSWNYLGFDGYDYIFVDEDGVKWHINDECIKFSDEENNVAYKFEIHKDDNKNLSSDDLDGMTHNQKMSVMNLLLAIASCDNEDKKDSDVEKELAFINEYVDLWNIRSDESAKYLKSKGPERTIADLSKLSHSQKEKLVVVAYEMAICDARLPKPVELLVARNFFKRIGIDRDSFKALIEEKNPFVGIVFTMCDIEEKRINEARKERERKDLIDRLNWSPLDRFI